MAMSCMIDRALVPSNARVPLAASYSTQPSENVSLRPSRVSPRVCSGDIYEIVPTRTPGWVNPMVVDS